MLVTPLSTAAADVVLGVISRGEHILSIEVLYDTPTEDLVWVLSTIG